MVLDDFGLNFTFYGEVPGNIRWCRPSWKFLDLQIRDFSRAENYGFTGFYSEYTVVYNIDIFPGASGNDSDAVNLEIFAIQMNFPILN